MTAGAAVVRDGLDVLADRIRAEHEACERDGRSAVEHAVLAGELLDEAQEALKERFGSSYGRWLPWLRENFEFSQQTASVYMRLAASYGASRNLPNSIGAALAELGTTRTRMAPEERRPAASEPETLDGEVVDEDDYDRFPEPSPEEAEAIRWQERKYGEDAGSDLAVVMGVKHPDDVDDTKPSHMAVHYSSATDEWATPQDFFNTVDAEFGFELDVCALPASAKCEQYFAPEDDGLAQEWTGTCWMNPPYGDAIKDWVRKAYESSQAGATVACLVPARVDTGWWWDYCRHGEVRFLRGRLKFGDSDTSAPFPSALVVFGRKPGTVYWEWR